MSELDKEIIKAVMGRGYQEGMPIPGFVEKIKQAIEKHIIGDGSTDSVHNYNAHEAREILRIEQRAKLHQK